MTTEDVYLSFLPLAHILDRVIEEYFFRKGASVGYYHGVCCLNIEPVHGKGRRKKKPYFLLYQEKLLSIFSDSRALRFTSNFHNNYSSNYVCKLVGFECTEG